MKTPEFSEKLFLYAENHLSWHVMRSLKYEKEGEFQVKVQKKDNFKVCGFLSRSAFKKSVQTVLDNDLKRVTARPELFSQFQGELNQIEDNFPFELSDIDKDLFAYDGVENLMGKLFYSSLVVHDLLANGSRYDVGLLFGVLRKLNAAVEDCLVDTETMEFDLNLFRTKYKKNAEGNPAESLIYAIILNSQVYPCFKTVASVICMAEGLTPGNLHQSEILMSLSQED